MEYTLSLVPCSLRLPESGCCVEFWDWDGQKRFGTYYNITGGLNVFTFFVETKTGHIFKPIIEVVYWLYK